MRVRWILSAAGFSTLLLASGAAAAVRSGAPTGGPPRQQQEEQEDYYRKWLREDVLYVITPQEKDVFQKLTNDDERDQFIEQFWLRRDPDPRTPANEFKLEHYRRIAYANENFSAGWPGWMTDRGKIYIIHGPPDEIEEMPSGGEYERTLPEGGGRTSVFPYQKWRYRYLEGVGTNVEVEFVDRDFSGIYRLALSPEEKDAFLHVPNAGFTAAEELGLAERRQRPYFAPHGSYPLMNYREQDSAFARYERFVDVQRPQSLRHRELKELVDTRVTFQQLPLTTRADVFRLNETRVLAPVTLEVANRDLSFVEAGGTHTARLAVYGVVSDLTGRVVREFEDELVAAFAPRDLQSGLTQSSYYNRVILLETGRRYKLELVAKDLASGLVGIARQALVAPDYPPDELASSRLVVADYIVPAGNSERPEDQPFVIGDVLVRPSLQKIFSPDDYFAVYLQIYHVAVDQSTLDPSFQARYSIVRDRRTVVQEVDEEGQSVQYFSPQRMVLIKRLPLTGLEPGDYQVEVSFQDRIRSQSVQASDTFTIR